MKTAIVSGGAAGIGKAITLFLLKKGVNVLIADIDGEAIAEIVEEFSSKGRIISSLTDTSSENEVIEAVRKCMEEFGRIDCLVNNAGISNPDNGPIEELSYNDWKKVIDVNLSGYFLFAKHCIPHLRKTGGTIINISSTRSIMSEPNTEAYSSSKGGVDALTHALANSLGPDIRVNGINPGWIEVSQWQKKSKRKDPALTTADHDQHPAGRVGTPEDIARLILFLMDPENSFITGSNFVVDGGMVKKMIYQ